MQEYNTGYLVGIQKGKNDASLFSSPFPKSDGTETYQKGYKNGYFMGYVKGIVEKIKKNNNPELEKLIDTRLEEALQAMIIESKQK